VKLFRKACTWEIAKVLVLLASLLAAIYHSSVAEDVILPYLALVRRCTASYGGIESKNIYKMRH
jgi:hypothetical protein